MHVYIVYKIRVTLVIVITASAVLPLIPAAFDGIFNSLNKVFIIIMWWEQNVISLYHSPH
jgi:hypothetical protein